MMVTQADNYVYTENNEQKVKVVKNDCKLDGGQKIINEKQENCTKGNNMLQIYHKQKYTLRLCRGDQIFDLENKKCTAKD